MLAYLLAANTPYEPPKRHWFQSGWVKWLVIGLAILLPWELVIKAIRAALGL
jgi:hypothetical protein